MLVQLTELPVDGEDVHVVVLLEVMGQQVQGVLASLQPLLVLMDLLHLDQDTKQMFLHQMARGRNFFTGVYVGCPKHPHRVIFFKGSETQTWSKFTLNICDFQVESQT